MKPEGPTTTLLAPTTGSALAPTAGPLWLCVVTSERDGDSRPTLVDGVADIRVGRVKSRVCIRYEGPTRLSWAQEQGDLKSVEAIWELEDLGDGRARVSYRFDADPGGMLGLVIRGLVQSASRAIFVDGRPGELGRRVEGG